MSAVNDTRLFDFDSRSDFPYFCDMHKVALDKLISRARDLADTGNYPDWREVAEALADEGHKYAIRQLSKDSKISEAIDLRCDEARRLTNRR